MRWPADRRQRQVHFSQLSKLLPTSNYMSVVNPGENLRNLINTLPKHMFVLLFTWAHYYVIYFFKVPEGKAVKVTFKKFLLSEPRQENHKDCRKDYVEINGKKWVLASLCM